MIKNYTKMFNYTYKIFLFRKKVKYKKSNCNIKPEIKSMNFWRLCIYIFFPSLPCCSFFPFLYVFLFHKINWKKFNTYTLMFCLVLRTRIKEMYVYMPWFVFIISFYNFLIILLKFEKDLFGKRIKKKKLLKSLDFFLLFSESESNKNKYSIFFGWKIIFRLIRTLFESCFWGFFFSWNHVENTKNDVDEVFRTQRGRIEAIFRIFGISKILGIAWIQKERLDGDEIYTFAWIPLNKNHFCPQSKVCFLINRGQAF